MEGNFLIQYADRRNIMSKINIEKRKTIMIENKYFRISEDEEFINAKVYRLGQKREKEDDRFLAYFTEEDLRNLFVVLKDYFSYKQVEEDEVISRISES